MRVLLAVIFGCLMVPAQAQETVKIYSPYSASHSGTPAMLRIIDEANRIQNMYRLILEFRPGGNQINALRAMDDTSLAIIAPAFVENMAKNLVNEADYVPVHALGDACWAVITSVPLTGAQEITVGGVGFGNAAHLTALALGEKYGFQVRYIVFKSNNDALINMTGGHGVTMVIDRYEAFESMRSKNSNLQTFAASCPVRLPQAPDLRTLKELGFDAPMIFNITVAHRSMPAEKRQVLIWALNQAQNRVGADEIFRLSGMRVPGQAATDFYNRSIKLVRSLQVKYRAQIEESNR